MRFKLASNNVKHFAKVLNVFSRFGDDVRIYTEANNLVLEVLKDDYAYGCVRVEAAFFADFDATDPIDKRFKSKAISHIFKNPNGLHKNLNSLEFKIASDSDAAQVTQSMRRFNRHLVVHEITSVGRAPHPQLSLYHGYPCAFSSSCRHLFNALREIPNSSGLASFRFRENEVRIETGESETEAEIYTHLQIFSDEFNDYKIDKPIDVTINSRPLKAFLTAWDTKNHCVNGYFSEESHQVFEITDIARMKAILAVTNIEREYRPVATNSLNTSAFQNMDESEINRAPMADANEDLLSENSSRRTFNIHQTSNSPPRDIFDSRSGRAGTANISNLSSNVSEENLANQPINSSTQTVTTGLRMPPAQVTSPFLVQERNSATRPTNSTQTLGTSRVVPPTPTFRSDSSTGTEPVFDPEFHRRANFQNTLKQLRLLGYPVDPNHSLSTTENTSKDDQMSEYEMSDNESFFDD